MKLKVSNERIEELNFWRFNNFYYICDDKNQSMKTPFTLAQFRIILSLILTVLISSTFSQNTLESKGSWNCYKGKILHKTLLDDKSINTPAHNFDVLKYTFNLDLYHCYASPFPNSFTGSVIVRFKVDTALQSIKLNAVKSSIVIDSVSLPATSFNQTNDTLFITLNRVFNAGEDTAIKIYYHHLNIVDGAFYTGNGFAYTDVEPEKARYWFPCWDKPSDKALTDLTVKVPGNVLFGSNGSLKDSVVTGDTIFYHWASRDPMATYLMVMTSKVNYNLDVLQWPLPSNPSIKIPVRYYYNSGEDPSTSENIIQDMMTFYSTTFCEYPFEKAGFCSLDSQFIWGGMENQTLVSFCKSCWGESLTSHEFAHHWFGDMITCGTWADIFLNEGFATYIEALWDEHKYGAAQYKSDIDYDASYYLSNNPGWAIYTPSWAVTTPNINDLFNYAITYCKGAGVLHMFRYTVGDSLFFASLKDYASDTTNFKMKNAVIPDFKTKMNQTCAQSMDWFFDEWLDQPNHPVYANTYSFVNTGGSTWVVNFLASQIQTNAGFFQMPIQLEITFVGGTDTIIRFMNNQNNQLFQFTFNKQPNGLTFDPNDNIVLKEGTTTVGINEYSGTTPSVILYQNIPNPTSGYTSISFILSSDCPVKICIYDVFGKIISVELDKNMSAGKHELVVNFAALAKGIYYYSLEAGMQRLVKKMVVL